MKKLYLILLLLAFLLCSCVRLSDFARDVAQLKNIEFRLSAIKNVRIAEIKLDRKRKADDLTLGEGLNLAKNFASGKMPVNFTIIVQAKNPNYDKAKNIGTNARILSFGFDLFIDDVRVANGNIQNPIELPYKNKPVDIPILIECDLIEMFDIEMFDPGSYKKLMQLGLNISGFKTDKVNIRMEATPKIETPIGNLSPGRITIIDRDF